MIAAQLHSETSREAAESIANGAATLRGKVLAWLRLRGPLTDEELQRDLAMGANTQRPRRVELQRAGLVRDSGQVGTTAAGRRAVKWEVVR